MSVWEAIVPVKGVHFFGQLFSDTVELDIA